MVNGPGSMKIIYMVAPPGRSSGGAAGASTGSSGALGPVGSGSSTSPTGSLVSAPWRSTTKSMSPKLSARNSFAAGIRDTAADAEAQRQRHDCQVDVGAVDRDRNRGKLEIGVLGEQGVVSIA